MLNRFSCVQLFVTPRLLCPWDSPGNNTGVGCHFLLWGIFPSQGSNPSHFCLLPWQVGSSPLAPPGKPMFICLFSHLSRSVCVLWAKSALCSLFTASLFQHLPCGLSCFPSTGGGGAGLGRETLRMIKQWSKRFQQLQESKVGVCQEQTSVCTYRPQT